MILQLDIGNTRVKWRQCHNGKVLGRGVAPRLELAGLFADIGKDASPAQVWVPSVAVPAWRRSSARTMATIFG